MLGGIFHPLALLDPRFSFSFYTTVLLFPLRPLPLIASPRSVSPLLLIRPFPFSNAVIRPVPFSKRLTPFSRREQVRLGSCIRGNIVQYRR